MQKLVAFLNTSNKATEKEIKESISFAIASKTIRYLGINLIKEVKDLYSENYRTLRKEIEEDTKKLILIFIKSLPPLVNIIKHYLGALRGYKKGPFGFRGKDLYFILFFKFL